MDLIEIDDERPVDSDEFGSAKKLRLEVRQRSGNFSHALVGQVKAHGSIEHFDIGYAREQDAGGSALEPDGQSRAVLFDAQPQLVEHGEQLVVAYGFQKVMERVNLVALNGEFG